MMQQHDYRWNDNFEVVFKREYFKDELKFENLYMVEYYCPGSYGLQESGGVEFLYDLSNGHLYTYLYKYDIVYEGWIRYRWESDKTIEECLKIITGKEMHECIKLEIDKFKMLVELKK